MESQRRNTWQDDYEAYSEDQVENVLNECGIDIVNDASTHFLVYCPFHLNDDSPACEVDKVKGLWLCFNPSCGETGTLPDLVRRVLKIDPFKAARVIIRAKQGSSKPFEERMEEALAPVDTFPTFAQEKLDELASQLWDSPGLDYMHSRGFSDETLRYFGVGYSPERILPAPYKSRPAMVTTPMHDVYGNSVGLIGRSIEGKEFKNSKRLPKSYTLWNIHRAKKHGDTVIVCESCFDAMRIHQAGYPNVVAMLGGHASPHLLEQLNRYFSKIILFTDFDERERPKPNCKKCAWREPSPAGVRCVGHRPGRELGRSIVAGLPNKRHMWAAYDDACIYPHGSKDACNMDDDDIRQCLKNAVSNLAYSQWGIEDADLKNVV